MSNNIIDFNEHRQSRNNAPKDIDMSLDTLMERMESLPENALMDSVAKYTSGRMFKQLVLTDVARQVSEMLQSIGLDPEHFGLDEDSADRFLADPELADPGDPLNGPFFDWYDNRMVVRVITSFQPEGDKDDDAINLIMAVIRLKDGAKRWQRWADGEWIEDSLPADFFENLDFDGGFDDDEDWDDEDDDAFRQEPWEDEYDESIYSLYLMPQTYRALSNAGIETIERLSGLTDLELLAIDGIDAKALEVIHDALDDEDMEAGE